MGQPVLSSTLPDRRWLALGRPAVRLEHLYVLLPLVFVVAYAALVPTPPNDFWWHLRVGQLVSAGTIPRTNLFAWTLPADTPYVYAWLAGWLFSILYQAGGMELVIFSRTLLLALTLLIVAVDARRRSGSWRLAGLAVGLAGALSLNNLIVRPQNWSWLPFVLTAAIVSGYAGRRLRPAWLAALPPLMLFWVNAHGAFVLGLLILGAYVAGEAARWRWRLAGALTARELAWLLLAAAATGLATLLNPYGPGIYAYLAQMTNNPSQEFIVEWQHPSPADPVGRLFYAAILGVIAVFALGRRRPGPSEVILLCGFLWLAWSMQRTVTWFGLLAGPVLAGCLGRPAATTAAPPPARPATLLTGLLAALLLLALVAVQPWFVRRLPLPDYFQARLLPEPAPGPLLHRDTPVGAVAYLRDHPGGRLFNEMGYGSYLLWALPDQPVFIDPRVEMYPRRLWEDYVAIGRGDRSAERLAGYGADRVLLSRTEQPRLSAALAASPGWQREYADEQSEIWRRTQ
jgi:hypothetical protein